MRDNKYEIYNQESNLLKFSQEAIGDSLNYNIYEITLYPVNDGNVLRFSEEKQGEFAAYDEYGYLQKIIPNPSNIITETVGQAAVSMATNLNAAAIICLTERGFTSRLISKYRPACTILAITSSAVVARKLSINWGVIPLLYTGTPSDEARIEFAISRARELGYVSEQDIVIVTAGQYQRAGGTDTIRVIKVEE